MYRLQPAPPALMLSTAVNTSPHGGPVKTRSVTLEQLPWSIVKKLTQLLDRTHPDHHSWSSLLSHAQVIGKDTWTLTLSITVMCFTCNAAFSRQCIICCICKKVKVHDLEMMLRDDV